MELTTKELEDKIKVTREEMTVYARNAQAEINGIQQALQNKVREAQKTVDNYEGKLQTFVELLNQASPKPETPQEAKGEKSNVVEFPVADSTPVK